MSKYSVRSRRTIAAAAALFIMATGAGAQTRVGVITGIVKDELGHAIQNVEVTATKSATTVRTDSLGVFTIAALPAGSADLLFRHLAFSPILATVRIPAGDTTDVEVTLSIIAQTLTAVVVQADGDQLRAMEAFEARRRQGIGRFITRAEIERTHPLLLSDMVRRVPGATVITNQYGQSVLRFARASRDVCPPTFFIDGIQATGFSIDDMPPSDVEGVELYAGPGGLPPEYSRIQTMAVCGTVLIWTRVPGNNRAKP